MGPYWCASYSAAEPPGHTSTQLTSNCGLETHTHEQPGTTTYRRTPLVDNTPFRMETCVRSLRLCRTTIRYKLNTRKNVMCITMSCMQPVPCQVILHPNLGLRTQMQDVRHIRYGIATKTLNEILPNGSLKKTIPSVEASNKESACGSLR